MTRGDDAARGAARWRRDRGRSLLGSYPVPVLHLVGAPTSPRPRADASPPTLQYGIDYSFTRRLGRTPVRWRPETDIIVRLADCPAQPFADAVTEVVGELRALTGLNLRTGQPAGALSDFGDVPEQEIHVACLQSAQALPVRQAGTLPGAGAWSAPDGAWYRRGWAIVDVSLFACAAPTVILRHQLCHALGLGHAARPSLLMHQPVPAGLSGYGRGDRHGLALLGPARPDPSGFPFSPRRPERTFRCG
jgi:hypothetical protein